MAGKTAGTRTISPAGELGQKAAFEFLKSRSKTDTNIHKQNKTKVTLATIGQNQGNKNQTRLKSLSTGELVSSTNVKKINKDEINFANVEKEQETNQEMENTKTEVNLEPAARYSVVEVEGEELPPNDSVLFSTVVNKQAKRNMENTDITPTQNIQKVPRLNLRPEGEERVEGYPVYIKCVDPKVDITRLNPIKLSKELVDQFHVTGQVGRSKKSLRVHCTTEAQRNQFFRSGVQLLDHQMVCSLPYRKTDSEAKTGALRPVRRVIRHVCQDVTDDELCAITGATAVHRPVRAGTQPPQATNAWRALRVTGANVSLGVVLCYENGTSPPAEVDLGWQTHKLLPYVPEPRRCYRCQKFGHAAKFCRRERQVCPVCSEEHTYENCPNKGSPKCANCSGNHSASYKKCSKYIEVQKVLARVAQTGETFREAQLKICEAGNVGPEARRTGIHREPTTILSIPSTANIHAPAANTQTNTITQTQPTAAPQPNIQTVTPNPQTTVTDIAESREGVVNPPPVHHCQCAGGQKGTSNISQFLVLAVQLILQTVQDKELAEKLSTILKKSAEELLGFSCTETQSTL